MIDKPDYTAMNDDELRRIIAERLGYQCVFEPDGYPTAGWRIYYLDGKPRDNITRISPEIAWQVAATHYGLPDWPHSVNAALALFPLMGQPEFQLFRGLWQWRAYIGDFDGRADDPARAICLAWLQWRNQNGEV